MPTPEKVAAPYLPQKPPRKWVVSKTGHLWQERLPVVEKPLKHDDGEITGLVTP